jgi:hypothetical protein
MSGGSETRMTSLQPRRSKHLRESGQARKSKFARFTRWKTSAPISRPNSESGNTSSKQLGGKNKVRLSISACAPLHPVAHVREASGNLGPIAA